MPTRERVLLQRPTTRRGDEPFIFQVFPGDPLISFARKWIKDDPQNRPFSPQDQSWGPFAEDGASFLPTTTPFFADPAQFYILCIGDEGALIPCACSALLATELSCAFDPGLPEDIAKLSPWLFSVAEEPVQREFGYLRLLGTVILQEAKKMGFKEVYISVDKPKDGHRQTKWRGYPCECIWTGPYCKARPLLDGSTRPDLAILAIDLAQVPDWPS